MKSEQFDMQVNRLKDVYGDKAFPDQRIKIIWREVQDFDASWFTRVVDGLIGSERYAPLMDKFAEAASKERERIYSIEKTTHTREAEHAMKSIYSGEDIKTICQVIQKRMKGQISDVEFESFKQTLIRAAGIP